MFVYELYIVWDTNMVFSCQFSFKKTRLFCVYKIVHWVDRNAFFTMFPFIDVHFKVHRACMRVKTYCT